MNAETRKLVLDLATGAIDRETFLQNYPIDPQRHPEHLVQILGDALIGQCADDVEAALLLGFTFGFPVQSTNTLCRLLEAAWHEKHEDIARVLGQLRQPDSIDALYRGTLARHPYLDYNDSAALAVKCVWALARIGIGAALEQLRVIADCDDRNEVRRCASERLDALDPGGR